MGRYIIYRLGGLLLVLWATSLLTFILLHVVPGGPFDMMAMQANKVISMETMASLNHQYGLDKPLMEQYLIFMKNAVRLDFGYSFYYSRSIMTILIAQWPYSLQLAGFTILFAFTIGLGLGIGAAIKSGSWIDLFGTALSLFCMALPSFIFGLFLQLIFGVKLHWVNTTGVTLGFSDLKQWVLPVFANSLGIILVFQRYSRGSIANVMRSNYVRTARSKGLSETRITFVHILKNGLTPVITVGGPILASLITGSIFVESVFRVPGVGGVFATGATSRDYNMVMGATLLFTAIIAITYLLTDVLYAVLDPRVSYIKET